MYNIYIVKYGSVRIYIIIGDDDVIIRKAELADAFSIAKVSVNCWKSTYKGIIAEEYLENLSYEQREQAMKSTIISLSMNKKFIFVAEDDTDGIVGFVSFGENREDDKNYKGEIYAIYILKEYQNKGIGKLLFKNAVDKLKENSLFPVIIWVLAENIQACRFYVFMGGTKIKEKYISIDHKNYNGVAYSFKEVINVNSKEEIKQNQDINNIKMN